MFAFDSFYWTFRTNLCLQEMVYFCFRRIVFMVIRQKARTLAVISLSTAFYFLFSFNYTVWSCSRNAWECETEKSSIRRWFWRAKIVENQIWLQERKDLQQQEWVAKAILFSYTRGGSTLLSDVFNIDPDSTYLWFEALQGFHSFYSGLPEYSNELRLLYHGNHTRKSAASGLLDARKSAELTNYLEDLLRCRLHAVPITTMAHIFMTKAALHERFWSCMESHSGPTRLSTCQKMLDQHCYVEEYLGVFQKWPADSIISKMTCTDTLAAVRSWKLETFEEYKTTELMMKYFEKNKLEELASYVRDRCSENGIADESLFESQHRSGAMSLNASKESKSARSHLNVDFAKYCSPLRAKFADFLNTHRCLKKLDADTQHCRKLIQHCYLNADLTVVSIHRSSMIDLEPLLLRMPDLHIVHYVRDPRAIAVSRAEKYYHTYEPSKTWTVVMEAKFMCVRMRDELQAAEYFEKRYPGSLITVRYEDLVTSPRKTVNRIHGYLKRTLREELLTRWIEKTFHARKDSGMYGVERRNGTAHIANWRQKVTEDDRIAMTKYCRHVLNKLSYEP